MPGKNERLRKIDQRAIIKGGGLVVIQEDSIAPPAVREITPPDSLVFITSGITRSTQAPLAFVSIGWQEAPNISPDYYNVEWSETSTFIDILRARANQMSATIEGLKVNTTYYFRVQAVVGGVFSPFSESLSVTTPVDTTPPPDVTGASAAFKNSDLLISFTKPQSEIYKDAEIKIYNSGHTVLLDGPRYVGGEQFLWTADQNRAATGGAGATSVSVDIRSRSWSNVFGNIVNVTATAAVPTVPSGVTSNWVGDTGLADEDLVISWLASQNADTYELVLDSTHTYTTRDLRFTYKYDQNVADHIPTIPSGQFAVPYSIRARDRLSQFSTAATGTFTNAAPPSGVLNLQATTGFSTIAAQVNNNAATIIQDFDHYEWALVSGGINQQSFISTTPDVIFQTTAAGTYSVTVKAVDKFNRKSPTVTVSGLVVDTLTIAELRAGTTYLDNAGRTSLDFLKDGFLQPIGSGQGYSAVASGTYNWIQASRPLIDRYKTVTFSATYVGVVLAYMSFDDGNGNVVWYAGPITTTSAGSKVLTSFATEALAKAQAFRLDLLGVERIDLPSIIEARKIRIYFSNYGGTLTAYEYYPRRLVQSDDVDAENIRGINIAALAVTADKISVTQLSAITANVGKLTLTDFAGGTNAWLYQGTGTGDAPTTGLKIFNSGGVGKLSTYNTGVEQVTLDTDGLLKAGAGKVRMGADGVQIVMSSAFLASAAINFLASDLSDVGSVYAFGVAGSHSIKLESYSRTGENSIINFTATAPSAKSASLTANLTSGASVGNLSFSVNSSTLPVALMDWSGALRVGTTTATATTGDIRAGNFVYAEAGMRVDTPNATNALFQLANAGTVKWSLYRPASTNHFYIDQSGTGARMVFDSNSNIGVGGTFTPTALLDVINGYIRARDGTNNPPSADAGLELVMTGGAGYMISYNRTSSAYLPLNVSGSTLNIGHSGIADIFIGANGRIGIGVGSEPTAQKLVVRGENTANTSYALLVQNSTPANLVRVRNDAALNETVVAWTLFSDIRGKENITQLAYDLDDILLLNPVKFDYKTGAKNQLGFIAQEVLPIIPEIVTENEEGMYGIQYELLIPILVNGIKDLHERIEKLEAR